MKKVILYMVAIFSFQGLLAQVNEIGVFAGGANPITDVGRDFYVFPSGLAYGLVYRWNTHKKFSLRAGLNKISLSANDVQSSSEGKKFRDFSFKNNLLEFNLGLEYHFFDFEMRRGLGKPITPYIYTGATYFWYDNLYLSNSNGITKNSKDKGRLNSWAVPIGVGVKAKVTSNLLISLEVGARYTFTNNLDGSFPKDDNLEIKRFGNKNSNDWYSVIGLMITYTFGEYPCYCW